MRNGSLGSKFKELFKNLNINYLDKFLHSGSAGSNKRGKAFRKYTYDPICDISGLWDCKWFWLEFQYETSIRVQKKAKFKYL